MQLSKGLKILGGTALALTIVALYRLNTLRTLGIDFVKANIVSLKKVYITLKISNPKNSQVTFNSINCEIFLNSINIGRIYYNTPIEINPNSIKLYVFPIILYPQGELQLLANLITTKAKEGIFRMKGNTMIDGIGFPIDQTIKAW